MTQKRFVYYEHKGADYILENPNTDLDFIEMLGDCLDEKLKTDYCSGHLEESDFEDSHLIIDGNEVNCKIEELRASGYSDEYINKELGHLVNWRI